LTLEETHALSSPTLPFNQLAEQCQTAGWTAENVARIAAESSRSFRVHDDEVAIFFLYPANLSPVGMLPLNGSSIAGRTATSKRPEIINNLPRMRHASIFEAVPLDSKTRPRKPDKNATVIQKMMSVPVVGPAGVLGVVQIRRKGSTQQSSGPDFQPADLQRLIAAANVLAKCFK
jgi:hypothetical protein